MLKEEWSFIRHYTYNPAWRKGKEAFFATDGGDQSMIVMFAPEGCVIKMCIRDRFYSFYYYSWQAVMAYRDVLEQVPAEFAEPAAAVLKLL